jgi:outer membrane immunogenic protein
MRYLSIALLSSVFMGSIAAAADLPVKAPAYQAPVMAPVYNWTGFYVGVHAGYGWGQSSWTDDPIFGGVSLGSHNINGGLIGGQIGYNWQMQNWVFGVEADGAWANIKGNHVDFQQSNLNTKIDALGTLTGRVGYAWNNNLFYVKGGGAWASFKYADYDTSIAGSPLNGASSDTRWGWIVGAGWEYGFQRNWSVKVEYDYIDFGSDTFSFSGGIGGNYVQTIDDHVQVVKVGLNHRFAP